MSTSTAPANTSPSSLYSHLPWPAELARLPDLQPEEVGTVFPKVLAHPKIGGQRWLAGQTRHGANAEAIVADGHDAGVVNMKAGGLQSMVAVANNRNGRHCQHAPYEGALIAVSEALRNLVCSGGQPTALTHHLQMALPDSEARRNALQECARGLAEAAHFFGLPVLAGNLDLDAEATTSLTVTAIGGLERASDATLPNPQRVGDRLVLLGGAPHELSGSHFVCLHHGLCTSHVPEVDLRHEKRLQGVVRTLIRAGVAASAHDLAPGGLLVTVAEKLLACRNPLGAKLDLHCFGSARTDALLFGESQGRAVLTVRPERVGTVLSEAHTNGVAATVVGEVTADPVFVVSTRRLLAQWTVDELRESSGHVLGAA